MKQIASLIAKREGKKHQASIGDIREILKIIIQLNAELDNLVVAKIMLESVKLNQKKAKKVKAK